MLDEDDGEIVRARRFEVLDDQERVRAVFGRLARPHLDRGVVGLEIFDHAGGARASLIDEEGVGLQMEFTLSGNQVLVLAAHESNAEVVAAGVSLTLCDQDGEPVLRWHVSDEGDVVTTATGS